MVNIMIYSLNDLRLCRRSLEIWTYKTKWRNERHSLYRILESIKNDEVQDDVIETSKRIGINYFIYDSDEKSIVVIEQNFRQYDYIDYKDKIPLDILLLKNIEIILQTYNYPNVNISKRLYTFNGLFYILLK